MRARGCPGFSAAGTPAGQGGRARLSYRPFASLEGGSDDESTQASDASRSWLAEMPDGAEGGHETMR